MNAHTVLDWIKANLFIVIFSLIMIAAPISMYFVASGMNKSVRDEVQKRGAAIPQLAAINVPMPSGEQVVPNEDLLTQYQQVSRLLADDSTSVQNRAVEFNRKGRDVLMPGVFPEPPFELRQIVPKDFHNKLVAAYTGLLTEVRAGSPPNLESLRQELEGMRYRFIAQDLKKDPNAGLDASEVERLESLLSDARISKYKSAAANIGLYTDADALFIPQWNQSNIPSASEMFAWQWQFWAVSDVLRALAAANEGTVSVANAPVKRLLGVVVSGIPMPAAATAGAAAAPAPRLSGGFGEGDQPPPPEESGDGEGAAPRMVAPKGLIPRDFSTSLSGYVSNPQFDVLTVDLAVIVEAARLPAVLDALSRYNFNTIINLRVEAADAFSATEQGFFFGGEPLNLVTIRMHSVWLRDWTKQFMPPETRGVLGIAPDMPPPPTEPS